MAHSWCLAKFAWFSWFCVVVVACVVFGFYCLHFCFLWVLFLSKQRSSNLQCFVLWLHCLVFFIAFICDFCGCSGAKVAKFSGFLFCVFATCVVVVFVGLSFQKNVCSVCVCGLCCLGGGQLALVIPVLTGGWSLTTCLGLVRAC